MAVLIALLPHLRHVYVYVELEQFEVLDLLKNGYRHLYKDSIFPFILMQMYSASFLGDLDEVVGHITTRYPKANLYGTGWSMGANILVQYLGKVEIHSTISVSLNLQIEEATVIQKKCVFLLLTLQESGARRFSGAVSMCNPFNLVMSDEDICQGFSRIYNRSLGKALGGILKKYSYFMFHPFVIVLECL